MGKSSQRLNFARAALAGLMLAALPMASFAFVSVGISVNFAPPALPVYVQPPCPAVGYIWTPGYWAWGDGDYYWVPGTWIAAPTPGLLWTPGYWGWSSGAYLWHAGYWGPHVGFYGGVNYGFGYTGVGFAGGYWRGNAFYYNRAVSNLTEVHVTNVYNKTVINNVTVNRVSFNGGTGGIRAQATAGELAAGREHHVDFTPSQREHEHLAFGNHDLRASVNGGKPRIAATARPAVFSGRDVIGARSAGAPYHAPPRAEMAHAAAAHNDRPPNATGNAGRGQDFHGGAPAHDSSHLAARTDRPPNNSARPGGSSEPAARPQSMNREQPPHQFNGGQPGRPQMAPRAENSPRPQAAPRAENAPRPQAPQARQEVRRGGGEREQPHEHKRR